MDIRKPKTKQLIASSRMVELPRERQATIQMLSATNHDGPLHSTPKVEPAQSNMTENPTPHPKTRYSYTRYY